MSDDTSVRLRIIEFVNIAFAIFAWILPDVPLSLKISISIILIGMVMVVHIKPELLPHRLSLIRFLSLWFFPLLLTLIEWSFVLFAGRNVSDVLQLGITYGLCIALPLTVFVGLQDYDDRISSLGAEAGCAGCLFQIIFGSILIYVTMPSGILQNFALNDKVRLGLIGPIPLLALSLVDLSSSSGWVLFIVAALAAFFQNAQFAVLGLWISGKLSNNDSSG